MKKICVVLALLLCTLLFVACNKEATVEKNDVSDTVVLTEKERKDIFVSYFNHSTEYSAEEIEQNLDKIEALQVLTLDEALDVFWKESGLSAKDYLHKTDADGQVYYQHKKGDNKITVFVSLLYKDGGEDITDAIGPEDYGFLIIQTDGDDYFVNINGAVKMIE